MPKSKPFSWLLAVGMLCSLAGLAFAEFPGATTAAEQDPTPETSATEAASSPVSNASPTVVTEATPDATPIEPTPAATPDISTAVANVVATPTQTAQAITAAPTSAIQSLPSNVEEPVELPRATDKAHQLFDLMNAARRDEGLAALEWDESLEEVAYARAANLVENGYFDHYAPDGESAFSELAARGIRYRLAGENLARNNYLETKTVAAAYEGLMNSPGHRANILEERFSSVGVATVKDGKMWIYVTVFLN
ncbi:MAG: CAP domain-containing protein [Dehalococcoidia bacterium]